MSAIQTLAPRWPPQSSGSFYVLPTRHPKRWVSNSQKKNISVWKVLTVISHVELLNHDLSLPWCVLFCFVHSALPLTTLGTRWTELPVFSIATNTFPAGQLPFSKEDLMERFTHSDEPTENYHLKSQFYWAYSEFHLIPHSHSHCLNFTYFQRDISTTQTSDTEKTIF